jgi:NADH dehydrogenase
MDTKFRELPNVVILGSGFGGMSAAQALAKAPVRVTLVDRHNYHLFQPLLYQVATAGLGPDEIAYPVHAIFRGQKNLEFRLAEVTGIDPAGKRLLTSAGDMTYDALIVSAGSATNFFGMDTALERALQLKDLEDAERVRNHILQQVELAAQESDPEVRCARLTFVVCGGGPTGVEIAGALSELVRLVLNRDYHLAPSEFRIVLVEASARLLESFSPFLAKKTEAALRRKGVDVRYGTAVTGYDGFQVSLKDGDRIATRSLIWAAGVKASPLAQQIGAPLGRQGRVKVLPTLQVPDHPEIFVIGDAAYLEDAHGQMLPMLAPVAMQEGRGAAQNALRTLKNEPARPFIYKDPGTLATIGRSQAVANIGGVQLWGFVAWFVWVVVHIFRLIGFRSRILVMIEWIRDYLFYNSAVLIISKREEESKEA